MLYMSSINSYRLYCTTDSKFETVWAESPPAVCPSNSSHTIDPSSIRIVRTVEESSVTINENVGTLNGYYKVKGEKMIIPETYAVGGYLTSPVAVNDTSIVVNTEALDIVKLDSYLQLTNGTTSTLIGRASCIHKSTNEIHLLEPCPASYTTSGTNLEIISTVEDFIQKKDMGVLSFSYNSDEQMRGDGYEVHVYPNEICGGITAPVSTGDTVLNVSDSVIDNIKVGFYCRLDDGDNFEDMGEVLEIDEVNKQLTIEKPSLHNFSPSSPTYVRLTIKMGDIPDIGPPGDHASGIEKIGSSLIKKNKPARVFYHNHTGTAKNFCFYVGHIY